MTGIKASKLRKNTLAAKPIPRSVVAKSPVPPSRRPAMVTTNTLSSHRPIFPRAIHRLKPPAWTTETTMEASTAISNAGPVM